MHNGHVGRGEGRHTGGLLTAAAGPWRRLAAKERIDEEAAAWSARRCPGGRVLVRDGERIAGAAGPVGFRSVRQPLRRYAGGTAAVIDETVGGAPRRGKRMIASWSSVSLRLFFADVESPGWAAARTRNTTTVAHGTGRYVGSFSGSGTPACSGTSRRCRSLLDRRCGPRHRLGRDGEPRADERRDGDLGTDLDLVLARDGRVRSGRIAAQRGVDHLHSCFVEIDHRGQCGRYCRPLSLGSDGDIERRSAGERRALELSLGALGFVLARRAGWGRSSCPLEPCR